MKKKIAVVDDEPLIAVLMKEIVEEDPQLEISRIVGKKDEFLAVVRQGGLDAAIVDISIGGREGGIELLQALKSEAPHLPIIMLSAHDELIYAPQCLKAGARAYINKRYICSDMVKCIKKALEGELFVSGDKAEFILSQHRKSIQLVATP